MLPRQFPIGALVDSHSMGMTPKQMESDLDQSVDIVDPSHRRRRVVNLCKQSGW
jgi:hypothetical protein